MPNRDAHRPAGIVSGGAAAAFVACKASSNPLIEGLGGAAGGWLGSRLPDIIDPPTSPRHRSVGHGVAPVAAAVRGIAAFVPEWQATLREKAARHRVARDASSSGWERLWHLLRELGCLLLSGALVGVIAGYLSHLAMDATTVAGIPFVA